MSDRPAAAAALAGAHRAWFAAAAPLAVGLVSLGLAFAPEITAAIRVWVGSTAFNHCFLILPIALYLLYARREVIAAAEPRPAPLMAAAAAPFAVAWLLAERAGIMEARQLFAMVFVQILVIATLGPRTWRVLAAPLLYLFFLVPVGEFAISWLQLFTVRFIALGLGLLGIPRFVDGIVIQIPEGQFLVAEACAGLRFVIASAAFGALYACLFYVGAWRRSAFIAASLVVPVFANGVRALAIVVLGHALGSAQAAAVDHVLYGWAFFALVVSLLILAGLPFRQVSEPVRPTRAAGPPVTPNAAAVAVIAVVAAAVLPRLVADHLDRSAAAGFAAAPIALPAPGGCRAAEVRPAAPARAFARQYECSGARLTLRLIAFPAQSGAGPIFTALRGASIVPGWDPIAADELTVGNPGISETWRATTLERQGSFIAVATGLWLDGRPSGSGVAARLRQAFAALRGPPAPPVVATVVTAASGTPDGARAALERFLDSANGISDGIAQSLISLR